MKSACVGVLSKHVGAFLNVLP